MNGHHRLLCSKFLVLSFVLYGIRDVFLILGQNMADEKKSSLSNPLYALASNDNSGTVITHAVLKGPNYEEWAKGFRVSLGAKRKLGFINGTVPQPEDGSADLDDCWTVNYMIVACIFNTIDPSIHSTISYRGTARDLWDDIK